MQGGHLGGADGAYEGDVSHVDEAVVLPGAIATDASDLGRAEVLEGAGPRPPAESHPDEAVEGGLLALHRPHRPIRPRQAKMSLQH